MIQDYCNRIHFCITVDEENLISAGVTLVSLLKNKPENTPLSIHLLADNLPGKERLYLKNLQKALSGQDPKDGTVIDIIDVHSILTGETESLSRITGILSRMYPQDTNKEDPIIIQQKKERDIKHLVIKLLLPVIIKDADFIVHLNTNTLVSRDISGFLKDIPSFMNGKCVGRVLIPDSFENTHVGNTEGSAVPSGTPLADNTDTSVIILNSELLRKLSRKKFSPESLNKLKSPKNNPHGKHIFDNALRNVSGILKPLADTGIFLKRFLSLKSNSSGNRDIERDNFSPDDTGELKSYLPAVAEYLERLKNDFPGNTKPVSFTDDIISLMFRDLTAPIPVNYAFRAVSILRSIRKFTINTFSKKSGIKSEELKAVPAFKNQTFPLANTYQNKSALLNYYTDRAVITVYPADETPQQFFGLPHATEWYTDYLAMCTMTNIPKNSITRSYSPYSAGDVIYPERDRPQITVSLTTFPGRIGIVSGPVMDMLKQTVRADRIVLWLSEEQFPGREKDLPVDLLNISRTYESFIIAWVPEDLKPHKKYYYAMQKYPNDIIITVDDDLHYSEFLIERLLRSYYTYPYCVSASRVHLMQKAGDDHNEDIAHYKDWPKEYTDIVGTPSMQLFPTCGAGTLFPPHALGDSAFNRELIMEHCLNADDVWLKVQMVLAGTEVVLADVRQEIRCIENSQNEKLWQNNVTGGGNDEQLEAVLNALHCREMFLERIFGKK